MITSYRHYYLTYTQKFSLTETQVIGGNTLPTENNQPEVDRWYSSTNRNSLRSTVTNV